MKRNLNSGNREKHMREVGWKDSDQGILTKGERLSTCDLLAITSSYQALLL
jgi:hypothetical protein